MAAALSEGYVHSSDVWLQPDSLLNFLHPESPSLDLIIRGDLKPALAKIFRLASEGEDVVCREGFVRLISAGDQHAQVPLDP